MLDAQTRYGPHDTSLAERPGYAAGRCLYRTLAEDRHDRQPLVVAERGLVLVADLRIDNRDEIADALGLGRERAGLSDADMLLRAWTAWGERALDKLLGDFAFAIRDERRECLLLARDTAGERPLHYRAADGFFAFASLPHALRALPDTAWAINERRMAQFVADLPPSGADSFFRDVHRLEPGHIARISRGAMEVSRYWSPRRSDLKLARREDYAEAMREELDRAVSRRLRRVSGCVASHLSAGLDSSAVTSSAAGLLRARGETLLAFTSAPRTGFAGAVPAGKLADESAVAAATAALHGNVEHLVMRTDGSKPLELLEQSHRLSGQPVGHVANNGWWQAINRNAAERKVSVMLTAEAGNLTLSAGGLDQLADLLRTIAWRQWWSEAQALTRRGYGWRNVANASLGPFLPKGLYATLRSWWDGYDSGLQGAPFVAPNWRPVMLREGRTAGWDLRPARCSRERRWKMLQMADPGNFRKAALAAWGVEERDPTADRRLVDFCFSLPLEALLDEGERRPTLRQALKGQVADLVLDPPLRGMQTADWYEQITAADARALMSAVADRGAASVIDLDAVYKAIDAWPSKGWEQRAVIYRYRTKLLRALSAAHFITRSSGGDAEPF